MVPGFGPIALGWGWMVAGMCLGVLLSSAFVIMVIAIWWCVRGNAPQPPRVTPQEHAKLELLRYIRDSGRPTLQELAEESNMSEIVWLYHFVGIHNVQAPQPALGAIP